jgi:hypothetical protein
MLPASFVRDVGFVVCPPISELALGAHLGTARFLGPIVACGDAAIAAARLVRHLPPVTNRLKPGLGRC